MIFALSFTYWSFIYTRAKKNVNIDDITESKFYQLQVSGIKLLDSLKEM